MRKMGAQTVIVDELGQGCTEWDRVLQEISGVRARLGTTMPDPLVQKLTFAQAEITDTKGLQALPDESFLGYAILVHLNTPAGAAVSYILESVVCELGLPRPGDGYLQDRKPLLNNYLHVKGVFRCEVGRDRQYELCGSFFCQQNTITSVCAHACAVMVLNNALGGSRIVTAEDVNRCLGVDHRSRRLQCDLAPDRHGTHLGLTPVELQYVFRAFGMEPYWMSFLGEHRRFYRDFLYSFVESGYPALLCFTTSRPGQEPAAHVVPVFGHTLNSDSWFPVAFAGYAGEAVGDKPFLSTVDWVADFLVHDDNLGLYFCLPGHSFRPEGHPDPGMMFTPLDGIGIYPRAMPVTVHGFQAQGIAARRLADLLIASQGQQQPVLLKPYYTDHFFKHHFNPGRRTAVFRPQLVTRARYLDHLRTKDNQGKLFSDDDVAAIDRLIEHHDYFWLVEVTEPELYVGNKSKVADVLIDPNTDVDQLDKQGPTYGVLLMRFPGFLCAPREDEYELAALTVEGHLPLFTLTPGRSPDTVW
jgi:hypothetical protein